MIIYKFCCDCDDEAPHRITADGPLDADLHTYCIVCKQRELADDKFDREEDPDHE